MSAVTDPIPPVPDIIPPIQEDFGTGDVSKRFNHAWSRWFLAIREKINVINDSLVNAISIAGTGLVVKSGDNWDVRSIQGTPGRISITNGDGIAGDPTIDIVGNIVRGVTAGSQINVDSTDPENPIVSLSITAPDIVTVPATASSTGSAGQIAFDSSYLYVCVATDTWLRTAITTW